MKWLIFSRFLFRWQFARLKYWLIGGPGLTHLADAETMSVLRNELKIVEERAEAALNEMLDKFPKSATH